MDHSKRRKDRERTHRQFDSPRASALHLHILRPRNSSLSHQLVTPYYKHLGARQYKTLLPIERRTFFGLNQYKSLVFLHTIRISDAQTLNHLLGLGPLVQTPTVGTPGRGRFAGHSHHSLRVSDGDSTSSLHGDLVQEPKIHVSGLRL
jgi:hypothetical protein